MLLRGMLRGLCMGLAALYPNKIGTGYEDLGIYCEYMRDILDI